MDNIFPEWEIGLFNFKEISGKDPLLWFSLSIRKYMYVYFSYIEYIQEIGMPSIELCFVSIKNSNIRFNIFIIILIGFVNVF